MFQVVVIGYKNHAKRVIDFLCGHPSVEKVLVYHPNSKKIKDLSKNLVSKIQYSSNWSDLINTNAFFICSPNGTHVDYIKKILSNVIINNTPPYIYCEKPPGISKKDLHWLKNNNRKLSETLYFGFNYRFSNVHRQLKEIISSGKIGVPIYSNFCISHGLAFKEGMQKNWRFNDSSIFSRITGNLGIHYVDMCLDCFGAIEKVSIKERNVAKNLQADTAIINLSFDSGMICNIFLSYATVFSQTIDVFFSDGLFKENNSVIKIFHPRDTFNLNDEFCQPKPYYNDKNLEKKYSESGLFESLSYFISKVESGDSFPKQKYNQSLRANEIFLNN
jgi:predicted dehydrogenase